MIWDVLGLDVILIVEEANTTSVKKYLNAPVVKSRDGVDRRESIQNWKEVQIILAAWSSRDFTNVANQGKERKAER